MENNTKERINRIVVCSLKRIALTLNKEHYSEYSQMRKLSNLELNGKVSDNDTSLFTYHIQDRDKYLPQVTALRDFFYHRISVVLQNTKRTVNFFPTKTFLETLEKGYHSTSYTNEELGVENKDSEDSKFDFLVTYLVKNLWHNLVHNHIQNINFSNYHEIKGGARIASEHLADNLATILTAYSFGHDAKSYAEPLVGRADFDNLIFRLRRLKCCNIFQQRVQNIANRKPTDIKERTLRTLVNYISGWLIANNLTVVDLRAFINNHNEVVFRLNRNYINSQCLLDISKIGSITKEEKRRFYQECSTTVAVKYRNILQKNPHKRALAANLLKIFFDDVVLTPNANDFSTEIYDEAV